jgi:hypothetical protein
MEKIVEEREEAEGSQKNVEPYCKKCGQEGINAGKGVPSGDRITIRVVAPDPDSNPDSDPNPDPS